MAAHGEIRGSVPEPDLPLSRPGTPRANGSLRVHGAAEAWGFDPPAALPSGIEPKTQLIRKAESLSSCPDSPPGSRATIRRKPFGPLVAGPVTVQSNEPELTIPGTINSNDPDAPLRESRMSTDATPPQMSEAFQRIVAVWPMESTSPPLGETSEAEGISALSPRPSPSKSD